MTLSYSPMRCLRLTQAEEYFTDLELTLAELDQHCLALGIPHPGCFGCIVSGVLHRSPSPAPLAADDGAATNVNGLLIRASRAAFQHSNCLTYKQITEYLQPGSAKGQLAKAIYGHLAVVGACAATPARP